MPANHSTEPGLPLRPLMPVDPVRASWRLTGRASASSPYSARSDEREAFHGPGVSPGPAKQPLRLARMAEDRLAKLNDRTRYDPSEVEPRVLSEWLEAGIFHPEATGTPEENFSIAIPPPNVTGELHMGHALNGTLQDVLTRTRRMQGRRTLWALGTDHAGHRHPGRGREAARARGDEP